MNYNLLKEVQNLYKMAYVPPMPMQNMQQGGPNPVDQMGTQNPGPTNPEQVMQQVMQGLQQGVQPQEIMQVLVSKGAPQQMVQQAIQQGMQQLMEAQNQQQGGPPGQGQGGPPDQGQGPDPEQVSQIVQQGLQEGVDPNEIMKVLTEKGMPQELVQQALEQSMGQPGQEPPGQEGPPPEEEPPAAPPVSLRDQMDQAIQVEKKRIKEMNASPEERILALEKKVEILTDALDQMMAPSQDATMSKTSMEALKYE